MARQRKTWVYTPHLDPRTKPSDALKAEVQRKANELIERSLKPRFVQPPPKKPEFNYVTDLSSRWHGRFFYFIATFASVFPNSVSPTFEINFARLEHTASGQFHLAFMRHTGRWHTLFTDLTLDECLRHIRDDELLQP